MADDPWKRFRERAAPKKQGIGTLKDRRTATSAAPTPTITPIGAQEPSSELKDWLEQVPLLLEQLNHLYNMYISGVEGRPPIEKRKHVENLLAKVAAAPKHSSTIRFKCSGVIQGAQMQFERWDKLIRGLEVGTQRRRMGGKKA